MIYQSNYETINKMIKFIDVFALINLIILLTIHIKRKFKNSFYLIFIRIKNMKSFYLIFIKGNNNKKLRFMKI